MLNCESLSPFESLPSSSSLNNNGIIINSTVTSKSSLLDLEASPTSLNDLKSSSLSKSGLSSPCNLDEQYPASRSQSEKCYDLSASAVSNIQLTITDDLTTQVDYYLNEV